MAGIDAMAERKHRLANIFSILTVDFGLEIKLFFMFYNNNY